MGFLLPTGAALVMLDCNPPTLTLLLPEVKCWRVGSCMGNSGAVVVLDNDATLCRGDFLGDFCEISELGDLSNRG